MQNKAYTLCLNHARTLLEFTHVAIWDIDEFIVLKTHDSIQGLIADHLPSGSLAINRLTFGLNGQEAFVELPVLTRFPCRMEERFSKNNCIKSIGRIRDLDPAREVSSPHRSMLLLPGYRMKDTSGNPLGKNHPDGVT